MPGIHLTKALESKTVKFIRWKVHGDWVEQIRIELRLNQVISCSNDENNALIIGCIVASTDIDSHFQSAPSGSQTGNTNNHVANSATTSNSLTTQQLNNTVNSAISQGDNYSNTTSNTNQNNKINNENTVTITLPASAATQDASRKHSTAPHQSSTAIIQSSSMVTSNSSAAIKRRPENNETVFKVYKGVKTFDFSMEKNLLITGGK